MRTLLSIIILLSLYSSAFAEAKSIYEIKQVEVIQKTPDFSTARDKAMTEAEVKAFDMMQTKLLEAKIISAKKKSVPTKTIVAAVDSIDVASERMSAGAYKAKFDVSFSPSQISQIFGIGFIEPIQDPDKFLVIPIKLEKDQVKLWKHEWWPYWTKFKSKSLILPVGDLQDVQEVKAEQLAANDLKSLQSMAFRYGANNIVLVQSEYVADSNSLKVQLEKIKDGIRTVVNYEYPGTDKIGFKELMAASAKDIAFRLENNALTEEDISSIQPAEQEKPQQFEANQAAQPQQNMGAQTPEPQQAPQTPQGPDRNYTAYDLMKNIPPQSSVPAVTPNSPPDAYRPQQNPNSDFQTYEAPRKPKFQANPKPPVSSTPQLTSTPNPSTQSEYISMKPQFGGKNQPAVNTQIPAPSHVPSAVPAKGTDNGGGQINVKVIAPDLDSWNRIKSKIAGAKNVQGFQVRSFSPNNSSVTVNYTGSLSEVQNSLASQGLRVYSDGRNLNISE